MSKPTHPGGSQKLTSLPASKKSGDGENRRGFVAIAAGTIGAIVGAVPLLAGLRVFVDPLTRDESDTNSDEKIRITSLDAMPEIGKAYRFPVVTVREDKWNTYEAAPIGAVFLRRVEGREKPVAFTSVCPHLGCSVDIKGDQFKCPCHNSSWTIDGERINPESCPSPRDLDALEVEMKGNEVFVAYKRFRGGIAEQIEE
jgi:menaquinol-cytochrome c reductase iron-sulfur subunit